MLLILVFIDHLLITLNQDVDVQLYFLIPIKSSNVDFFYSINLEWLINSLYHISSCFNKFIYSY